MSRAAALSADCKRAGKVAARRTTGVKMADDGRGSLISPNEVAPSRTVDVCLCYIPLHRKVQKRISSGTGLPG